MLFKVWFVHQSTSIFSSVFTYHKFKTSYCIHQKKKKNKPDFFLKLLSPSKGQWHPTPVLLPGKSHGWRSLRVGDAKSWTRLSNFTFTFHFHGLEKEMATYSSVLALRIPGTGEPGGLPSMGSHRVGHDWSNLAAAAAAKGWQIEVANKSLYFKNDWNSRHVD